MLLEIWKTKRIWVRVYEKLGGEGYTRAKGLAVLVELYNNLLICNIELWDLMHRRHQAESTTDIKDPSICSLVRPCAHHKSSSFGSSSSCASCCRGSRSMRNFFPLGPSLSVLAPFLRFVKYSRYSREWVG